MSIEKASLITVAGDQLPDATIFTSLAILLSARITLMPIILEPKVRVVATKAMAIKAMFGAMSGPMVGLMPWMHMSNWGIQLISLGGINQVHLAIMSIRLVRLSQETKFRNRFLQSIP